MTDIKHKATKYVDQIMERIDEDRIRDIVFKCWEEAFRAGYGAAVDLHRKAGKYGDIDNGSRRP